MEYIPIQDSSSLPRVPLLDLPREWLRFVFHRYFPWALITRLRLLVCGLGLSVRGGRREKVVMVAVRELMPSETSENLRCLTIRTKVLKRLGRRTFAPVYGRSRADLIRLLKPVGLESLDAFKEKAQGVVIVTAHAGYYSWVGPALLEMGYPVHLIQQGYASSEKLFIYRKTDWWKRVLPYPPPGQEGFHLKMLHDMLLKGEWLQHTGDYPDAETGIEGELFGRRVRCVRAPWLLARLSSAPAVPVVILADEKMQPRMFVGPAIHVSADIPPGQALAAAFQAYLNFLEKSLQDRRWNLHPEQWIAMTKREIAGNKRLGAVNQDGFT